VECVCFVLALALQAQTTPRAGQMPTLPLTQLDESAPAPELDNRAFTFTFAQPIPVRDVLLQLVRGTSLSVVPDPAIAGTFTGELKNVTVRQALSLILPPLGLDFTVAGGAVRVFRREPETRIFGFDYIAAERTAETTIGGTSATPTSAAVTMTARTDVFGDIAKGVQTLLSDRGSFNVDRKAGLLQVTDFPERLDRVAAYLDAVQDRVLRQVQIDARVIEVELKDDNAQTLDWSALGGRVMSLARVITALEAQGKVTVLASPRLVTVNNEPAIVRTDALTLTVTPQIAPDAAIMLDVSPMLSAPAAAEADMLARVADGDTVVLPGFTRERETRETKNMGSRGGWFGRGTVVTRKRVEVVILLTPRLVAGAGTR
jgi:type II secretory pathway component GspD/PulD (secretin)